MSIETEVRMIDIRQPLGGVELRVARQGDAYSLWVNVDGLCRLRIQVIPLNTITVDVPDVLD
jgi:hypothetical protein